MELNFDALENTDFSVGKKSNETEKLNWLGGAKQTYPLDMRILINMSNPDEANPYFDASFHEYIDGTGYYRIPCMRSVGEVCPICDHYWDHKKHSEQLAVQGAQAENHPLHVKWKQHEFLKKKFQQKKGYLMLVALKGDDKISVFSTKTQQIKAIFGDAYKKLPGAIDELKSYGVSVFNPYEVTGWISLNKSGQGLQTTYSAKPSLISEIKGKMKTEKIMEEPLHPKVIEAFKDMGKLPALRKRIQDSLWSQEELETYIISGGIEIPERVKEILNKNKKEEDKPKQDEVVNFSSEEEFIPF